MTFLILTCLVAFLGLLWLLRKDRISLGLPIAYLYSLLLIHVPGAFAHVVGHDFLLHSDLIEIGMRFATLGSACFVIGVWLSRSPIAQLPISRPVDNQRFWRFCLFGGWFVIYGLSPLYHIPSVSAAVEKGGGVWMLGVMLGLRAAFQQADYKRIGIWVGALLVYPVLMLLLGGFLSYGSAAIIVVCAALTISTRGYWWVIVSITVFTFLSITVFVNYFPHRDRIRNQVWGGTPLQARVDSVLDTARDFKWFDSANRTQLISLDARLNQNYFVGLAAKRIELGQVGYLKGESVWEGVLSLVPRAFWPDKPVVAGSPQIVAKMTGLRLSPTTSFGVGNVMEFQINFGVPGVIIGFVLLGWLIGKLDLEAALAEGRGDLGTAILFFLPCLALIQPNGSLVELCSGAAAALVGALAWKRLWKSVEKGRSIIPIRVFRTNASHLESSRYRNQSAT